MNRHQEPTGRPRIIQGEKPRNEGTYLVRPMIWRKNGWRIIPKVMVELPED